MSNNKMKGLLKGLRYISQIFDNEKEQEMQIGFPTDVKHVAHIGWDGPSVNSPSWMNEFKSPQGFSSAPLGLTGDMKDDANSGQKISEDPNRRSARNNSGSRDLPELPKSSRRHSAGGSVDSPTKEKTERTRQRRSSKNSNRDSTDSPKAPKPTRLSLDSSLGSESPSRHSGPDIPKKTRRKKSKDTTGGGGSSSRSRSTKPPISDNQQQYQSAYSDPGPNPESEFGSKSHGNELYRQRQSFEGEEKGLT
ncbi:CRIB domain-containing protein RIC6 [Ziziphus jujuba]|uniref:CRIB domain-containing protein RIC6 n=1 Tax=Ziziphus jujuba TaxID=326968 RepID=A0A6P6GG69_ZIZJJ|nr:CRIB domain-containing protein RIC6 [Ziziphus jujuba var. spinosa]XP_060676141.1 CRIB domain-containing protein RIC6 [Ziziphus jujuba]